MARLFTTSQSADNASAVLTAYPITLACWVKPTTSNTNQELVSVNDGATGANLLSLRLRSTGVIAAQANGGATGIANAGAVTNGVWCHACAVHSAAASRVAYKDGVAGTPDTTNVTLGSLTRTTVGAWGTAFNFADSAIAEAAIWNVALTAADVASLAAGVSPLLVRPDALVFYAPLLGVYSPEIDIVGRRDLTITGATAITHPPIIRPSGPLAFSSKVGAAQLAASPSFNVSTVAPLSLPRVVASRADVGPGGVVNAVFTEGRGYRNDWIALYPVGASNASYLDYWYLTGTKTPFPTDGVPGTLNGSIPFTAPLTPGSYEFRFWSQDAFILIATSAPFVVAGLTASSTFRVATSAALHPVSLPLAVASTFGFTATGALTTTGRFTAASSFGFSTDALFAVARFFGAPGVRFSTVATLTTGTEAVHATRASITLADVDVRVRVSGLSIRDVLNDEPNTCSLVIDGSESPEVAQALRISINLDAPRLLFNGALQTVDASYEGLPANKVYPATAIDDTPRANRRRPFGAWTNVSATTGVQYLVAVFAPGFTTTHVQAFLPAVSVILDGSEGMNGALTQIANLIGGYFYWDLGDLHFFLVEASDAPDAIDDTPGRFLDDPPISASIDASQLRTRQYGKGHGEALLADVLAGETIIPVANAAAWFGTVNAGGRAIAVSQILQYTGVQTASGGSLVGPGAGPSVAPTVQAVAGTGLADGVYKYAYTDVTAIGESIPSPLATASAGTTVGGFLAAPVAAPTTGAVAPGNVPAGSYAYAVTFANAVGETPIGPASAAVAVLVIDPPTRVFSGNTPTAGGSMTVPGAFRYALSFLAGSDETSAFWDGGVFNLGPGTNKSWFFTGLPIGLDSRITGRNLYRSDDSGATWHLLATLDNVQTFYADAAANAGGVALRTTNNTGASAIDVANIPIGPTGTTSRKLYRNGSLVATISNNSATTLTDNNATAGAAAPSTNTTGTTTALNQIAVSGIAQGGAGTTSRKVYRTAANGSQLKLLATIANNTATTLGNDSTVDASLGANAPTVDTSGLGGSAVAGAVLAGSTTLPTSGAGPFNQTVGVTGPVAPVALPKAGSGIADGLHRWAVTFTTAAGETLPGPFYGATMGPVAAPPAAPFVNAVYDGPGVDVGVHDYAYTYVTAAGETTLSPAALVGVTVAPIAAPLTPVFVSNGPNNLGSGTTRLSGRSVSYKIAYVTATGETLPSGALVVPVQVWTPNPARSSQIAFTFLHSTDPSVIGIRVYSSVGGGPYYAHGNHDWGDVTGLITNQLDGRADTRTDTGGDLSSGANPSTDDGATAHGTIALTINVPPGGYVTDRKLYRRFNGTGTYKLVATLPNGNAYTDTTPNASLGAAAPTVNTAGVANQAIVAAIDIGPTGVTGRKLYRTVAGDSQLKLLDTIADNTTTQYTDSTPDGSLGANAPTVDTSGGLTVAGGWALIGSNLAVRYTGVSGNTLTGIPSTGPGSILTTVLYGSQVLPAPALTGVTGIGSPIVQGTPINIWVQRDDLAAQATQAVVDLANGVTPADGVYEAPPISDERRGETSLTALCDAHLARYSRPLVTVRYATRDLKTRSGKPIVIDLVSPPIHETLTIQECIIDQIDVSPGLLPRFTVTASSDMQSLDGLLRQLLAASQ